MKGAYIQRVRERELLTDCVFETVSFSVFKVVKCSKNLSETSLFIALLCAASTAAELKESLDIGFTQICTWYCENKLSLNVKKTKLMLSGSKNTLTVFENF